VAELVATLLHDLIDYAGLFPPARLSMEDAVGEYARELAGPDRDALGRFVVPAARLDELESWAEDLLPRDGGEPWRLSVLAQGTSAEWARIEMFDRVHAAGSPSGHARIEAVELAATSPEEVAAKSDAFRERLRYVEVPVEPDPRPLLEEIARQEGRAKIRTGGPSAAAIPSIAAVARFVVVCAELGLAFKATAGLHHPLRGEHLLDPAGGSTATLHGFLNLFVAAALARTAGIGEAEVRSLLEERSPAAFAIAGDRLRWRGHELTAQALEAVRRDFAVSFGSCSFREPLDEWSALTWT